MKVTHPFAFSVLALALSQAVFAAEDTASKKDDADSVLVLGEVNVNASREVTLPARSILTSVDVMGAEQVKNKNVRNSWELMGQVPGVQLTEFNLGAESGKPSFRAFNGEGYINGVKLLIDGIPSNINSGNMRYMDMVFPADIEYVEVVRGTNDPRYGLHNIGGNINVGTRQGGNYTEGRLTYGSFNTSGLQATMGREAGGVSQNYFVATQDTDGFRANSKSKKYGVGGKWFYTSDSSDLRAGVIVRLYNNDAQEAGYLTATELAANRSQSPAKNANDHDNRNMKHISGHVDYSVTSDVMLSNKLYLNTIMDDRFVTYTSYSTGTAARQQRLWNENHFGWLGSATWQASEALVIDGGMNVEHQNNQYQRYRYAYALPTDFSTPATTSNDDVYTVDNVGAYVQAIIRPNEHWKIIPALRGDNFKGSSTINTTGVNASMQDYGWINQPKLSVVYSPVRSASIYANWGRTFQILTGSRTPTYMTTGTQAFNPSINTGMELGIKMQPTQQIEGRLAVWQQDATNEVANLPSAGTTQNLGETRRKGVDFQLTAHVIENTKLWLSHSIQEARVVGGYTSGGVYLVGKEVFNTPSYISNVGAEYQASESWSFNLQGRAQGSYYIDNLNAKGKYGEYVLFDGGVNFVYSKNVGLDLQVKNLFDRKYEYVWYDNFFWPAGSYQPMFSPGAGRSLYLSLNLKM